MTTANKHRARSHRSYNNTKAKLGSVSRSTYYSRESKSNTVQKLRVFKKLSTRLGELKDKLSDNVKKMFKK